MCFVPWLQDLFQPLKISDSLWIIPQWSTLPVWMLVIKKKLHLSLKLPTFSRTLTWDPCKTLRGWFFHLVCFKAICCCDRIPPLQMLSWIQALLLGQVIIQLLNCAYVGWNILWRVGSASWTTVLGQEFWLSQLLRCGILHVKLPWSLLFCCIHFPYLGMLTRGANFAAWSCPCCWGGHWPHGSKLSEAQCFPQWVYIIRFVSSIRCSKLWGWADSWCWCQVWCSCCKSSS